jgi:hypothetical protein
MLAYFHFIRLADDRAKFRVIKNRMRAVVAALG